MSTEKVCIRCGVSGFYYTDRHDCHGTAVANAYLFPNGMIAAFDIHGQQIPELQGEYTEDLHRRIIKHSTPLSRIEGFPYLITT